VSTASAIDAVELWYHTLDLPGGATTPGWFDLRGVVDRLPWPDVSGRRCLDVGTYDGFFAFELERRGAREVVATDIEGHGDWDYLPGADYGASSLAEIAGEKGLGFEVAKHALQSNVERRIVNVYDLSEEEVGTFDVVVCGSLLLHLRDPVRALQAIRSVCESWLLSVEEVSLPLSVLGRRRPLADVRFDPVATQWWVPNAAGHARMLEATGFEAVRRVGPFCVPYGVGHTPRGRGLRPALTRLGRRLFAGGDGVPHAAALARAKQ
jgi:tRNA (mo5U34)-methyltransferase